MGLPRGGDSLTDDIGLASRGAEARPSVPSQTLRLLPSDSNGRGVPCGHLNVRAVPFGHSAGYVGQPLSQCISSSNLPPPLSTSAALPPPLFSGSGSSPSGIAALHPHAAAEVPPDTYIRTTWSQPRAATSDADAAASVSDGQVAEFSAAMSPSTGLGASPLVSRPRIEEPQ